MTGGTRGRVELVGFGVVVLAPQEVDVPDRRGGRVTDRGQEGERVGDRREVERIGLVDTPGRFEVQVRRGVHGGFVGHHAEIITLIEFRTILQPF
jgi:hypothetical protein